MRRDPYASSSAVILRDPVWKEEWVKRDAYISRHRRHREKGRLFFFFFLCSKMFQKCLAKERGRNWPSDPSDPFFHAD